MYDVLSAFFCKYKKAIVSISICVACVFAAFYAGYLCGIRNADTGSKTGNYISDNGVGADTVRGEIGDAGSAISAARSGIDNAAAAADRIETRVNDTQERVNYVKGTVTEDRKLVADCQRILATIRSRGKKEAPEN